MTAPTATCSSKAVAMKVSNSDADMGKNLPSGGVKNIVAGKA
jgi:hypothetical protein